MLGLEYALAHQQHHKGLTSGSLDRLRPFVA